MYAAGDVRVHRRSTQNFLEKSCRRLFRAAARFFQGVLIKKKGSTRTAFSRSDTTTTKNFLRSHELAHVAGSVADKKLHAKAKPNTNGFIAAVLKVMTTA